MDFADKKSESIRRIFAVIAIGVTLYYLWWRVTETLNPNAVLFSWALYGAEVFGAVTTFLFYFMVWRPIKRTAPPPLPGRTVDVFIPTKSEPIGVLRKTLLACNDLKYPHRTLVLDDGGRPEVKALAEELKCVYLARETHEHHKAGNLNYGLGRSNAEFIAVFDADHIPLPHFIDRLIGYFADEKVAVAQAPQEFYNIDSFQHRIDRKKRSIWGEQYLFFSLIQPGKDRWNAAYFVGSCAILRRKALDGIGGFATGSITEDMLTSIRLHAKKWSSVYHNENLAYGIAAETLEPFHIQRQRWGLGNWQIFFKANPLFIRGLTMQQRISYFTSMIYPMEGIQKMVFYATPPIALFTGVLPMRALDVNYLLHFIPYFAISIFGFNEMARGFGGQIMLEQFSMGKFFTYLKTMVMPVFPKRSKAFRVTPKGEAGVVPSTLIIPQMLVLFGSLVAIGWALMELLIQRREDAFVVAVNCFWALYNSGLALAIIQYDYKKLFQRRTGFRIPDAVPVFYQSATAERPVRRLAVADNLTENGLSLVAIGQLPIGQNLRIDLMLPARTVILHGDIVQEKSITVEQYPVSHIGVRFKEVPQDIKDVLARYLHESAVSKFMREYSTRYKTYIEKRFQTQRHFHERAYRALAYLPVIVLGEGDSYHYAVIKDLSQTGLLLASRVSLPPGSPISMNVILGKNTISLKGSVVRNLIQESEDYPEYLLGVHFDDESNKKVPEILGIAEGIGGFMLE
jgi:cellulose synthase (UDP-forming)